MAVAFGQIHEFEHGRVRIRSSVDQFVHRQTQNLVNDWRKLRAPFADERIEVPVERATHLDRAVGQFGCERAIARSKVRLARTIVERLLRAALGSPAGCYEHIAHGQQRYFACVHVSRSLRERS